MKKLIKNALIITMDKNRRVLEKGCILIENDQIKAIGETLDIEGVNIDVEMDAYGKVILPGIINGHNHHDQSFMKGITRMFQADGTLDWIKKFKNTINREMNKEDYYLSNMLTATEMIRNGVTCSVNNISQQNPNKLTEYVVEMAVQAVRTSGVRSLIAVGVADDFEPQEFLLSPERALDIIESSIQEWNNALNGCVKVWAAPNLIFSASAGLWKSIKQLVDRHNVGIHTHLGTFRYGDFELAEEYGFLGPNVTAAHCTYLNPKEIDIIVERGVKVVHNPVCKFSNINKDAISDEFGSGLAPIAVLHEKGVIVGLGVDAAPGDTQDMFKEMREFAFVQRYKMRDNSLYPPSKLLELISIDCAQTMLWDEQVGSLEEGKKADLIIINMDSVNFYPKLNLLANLVYLGSGYNVETVIINGEIVMENRQIKTFDEKGILDEAQKAAESLIDRAGLSELKRKGYKPWCSSYKM